MYLGALIAQSSAGVERSLFERMEPNVLGAALILGVIFSFVLLVVLITTVEKITLAKMSRSLIDDMIAKGYSPEEIRTVIEGEKTWAKVSKFFGIGKHHQDVNGQAQPSPPVKRQSA